MNSAHPSQNSTAQSQKSAPALTLTSALFAIAWSVATALTTTCCKTRQTSQHLQYDRQVITSTEAIKTTTLRDNTITDITIIDFDTATLCRDALPCVSQSRDALPCVSLTPTKITHIHRQNNIQTTQSDSTLTSEQSMQKTNIIQQNKSSPDKTSHAFFYATAIIVILIIFIAVILAIKFAVK